MNKTCSYCHKKFIGRVDKKFCSPDCKARAHIKRKKAEQVEVVVLVNKILLKNRSILSELMDTNKQKTVSRIDLIKEGFNFQHFTGNYLNKQGKYYYYVYDFAWMEFSGQEVMIVRK